MTERKGLTVKIAPVPKPNANAAYCESLKPVPGPGNYKEVEKAKSFVLRKTHDFKIGQEKKQSVFDVHKDRKKWVPASATYKVEPEVFNKLSKSPVAM